MGVFGLQTLYKWDIWIWYNPYVKPAWRMGPRLAYVVSDQGVNLPPFIARLQPRSLREKKTYHVVINYLQVMGWSSKFSENPGFCGWNFSRNPETANPGTHLKRPWIFLQVSRGLGDWRKQCPKRTSPEKYLERKKSGPKIPIFLL